MRPNIAHLVKSFVVLFFSLDLQYDGGLCSQSEVDKHLEMGKKFLQEGQLSEALQQYTAAIDGDPGNYLTYFKRAAVYLAIGQAKKALPDLDKTVELKQDFHKARSQRASTLLKLGRLEEAEGDLTILAGTDFSGQEEARVQLSLIPQLVSQTEAARKLMAGRDYYAASEHLGETIEVCPWDLKLRELRAECFEAMGMYQSAISDIKMCSRLQNDNTDAFYRMSLLYYQLGEEGDSLREIRECLRLDPDHKLCFPHYKKVKKLDKQLSSAAALSEEEKYSEAAEKYLKVLDTAEDMSQFTMRIRGRLCHTYYKLSNLSAGQHWCGLVLELEPENIDALCDRAELFISHQLYEDAVKDYQTAQRVEEHPRKVDDGLAKAERLLKQSQKRDYYKILGVSKTASKNEINKAYRNLAREWHPDSYEGEDQEKAEKMFYDIAAAKEVLTDKDMRERFDNGEDPLDPEQNQHGGHQGPFGFPFGQQGFTFKFRYT